MNRNHLQLAAALAFGLALPIGTHAAIVLDEDSLQYAQDFDSLPNVNGLDPAWTNDATLPGWYLFAGPALDQTVSNLRVATSSGTDRAHISYGIITNAERALGFQAGSSHRYSPVSPAVDDIFGAIAVAFVNGTDAPLGGFAFSYTGEQWHVSSNANVAHSLTVAYAIGSADTAFHALDWQTFETAEANAAGVDFHTPILAGGITGDGNLPQNRIEELGATVADLNWAPGDVLWLRWTTLNYPASDHGMAIDDFSIAFQPAP